MTSCGMPMSAMTTSPACASPGGSTSGSFGAASVTVIDASMQSPIRCGVSADSPLGRSIETIGMPEALTSATTVSSMPASADFRPVPKIASTISEHCEISEKCSSHACSSPISTTVTPRRPRMSRLMRASPRTSASAPIDEDRGVDAALQQRARDDEAVAAVVAAAAQHGDAAVEPRLVRGLDGGHDLAAGVLHQHERRDADVLDGEAIGLAHLRGVEDAHRGAAVGRRQRVDGANVRYAGV